MSNRKWREETIAQLAQVGVTLEDARWLLRQSATIHRLAEAQCNGDWPFDNGVRPVVPCPGCEGGVLRSALRKVGGKGEAVCPDCAVTARVKAKVAEWVRGGRYPGLWEVKFQGDPRGCCMTLVFEGRAGMRETRREIGIAG